MWVWWVWFLCSHGSKMYLSWKFAWTNLKKARWKLPPRPSVLSPPSLRYFFLSAHVRPPFSLPYPRRFWKEAVQKWDYFHRSAVDDPARIRSMTEIMGLGLSPAPPRLLSSTRRGPARMAPPFSNIASGWKSAARSWESGQGSWGLDGCGGGNKNSEMSAPLLICAGAALCYITFSTARRKAHRVKVRWRKKKKNPICKRSHPAWWMTFFLCQDFKTHAFRWRCRGYNYCPSRRNDQRAKTFNFALVKYEHLSRTSQPILLIPKS